MLCQMLHFRPRGTFKLIIQRFFFAFCSILEFQFAAKSFFYKVKVLKLSAGITLWHSLPSRLCVFFIQFPTQKSLKSFIKKNFFPNNDIIIPTKIVLFHSCCLEERHANPSKSFCIKFFYTCFSRTDKVRFPSHFICSSFAQSFLLFSPPIFLLLLHFKRISFQPISFRNFNSKKRNV